MATEGSHPPPPCRIGQAIAPHVPDAPASWTSGPGPAIAFSCSYDKVDPGAALAGYPIPGGGSCVSAYSSSLGEAFGELCEPAGTGWTSQCERLGCVHYFSHKPGSTVLAGPASARTNGVWVELRGEPPIEGVMLGRIYGKRQREIGAKERFSYFGVYVPRCAEPNELKVHLVSGSGKQLGLADPWDVEEPPCPGGSGRRSS
ncbi:MAG TPA: hypothetical protein VFJ53_09615 [Solirubrobacterales bacterium]|nr:hypothetical protein [Solirubrobacterales bacterium]